MNNLSFDKSLIHNPAVWNLYIALDHDGMEIMAFNPFEDSSLLTAAIPFDDVSPAKAFENIVYDNPILLSDFKKTSFLIRDTPHAVIPSPLLDDNPDAARIAIDDIIGHSNQQPLVDSIPQLNASIAYRIDPKILNFINRTFTGARFNHRLSALSRFWSGTDRSASDPVTRIHLRKNALDIVVFIANRLLFANSFKTTSPNDALYFILAVRELTHASRSTNAIIAGDKNLRDSILPLLSPHIDNILPAVFPAAMFRAGGQTALNTPLDLVVLPLCE